MKALLIDHDDSFTYNLQDWLRPIFAEVQVVNHREIEKFSEAIPHTDKPNTGLIHDLIVLSPGPKSPQDYPHVLEFIKTQKRPIFGVCLGLQPLLQSNV